MWTTRAAADDGHDPELLALGRDKRFLRDEVYRVLRRWILEQRLTWGQELVETTLAARMGVSRTPIRESIRQLEADGLVERYASGGVRVRRFSARDIREIYDVLLPLFELSATLASDQYDPAGWPFVGIGLGACDLAQISFDCDAGERGAQISLAGDCFPNGAGQLRSARVLRHVARGTVFE